MTTRECPVCHTPDALHVRGDLMKCTNGCRKEEIRACLNGASEATPAIIPAISSATETGAGNPSIEGPTGFGGAVPSIGANGNGVAHHDDHSDYLAWKRRLSSFALTLLRADPEYDKPHLTFETVRDTLVGDLKLATERLADGGNRFAEYAPPATLNQSELAEDLELVALAGWEAFRPGESDQANDLSIVAEDFEAAVEANRIYLQRPEIASKWLYGESISLIVGPKHGGKTTCARTLALSVAAGTDFFGRQTKQGHVIYAASEDEVASTRMELLRMGWVGDTALTLVRLGEQSNDNLKVLEAIRRKCLEKQSILVVLDMLFDFTKVTDELSYAGTREATKWVMWLAKETGAHIVATHHSPKHLPDAATAAVAALGSQGLAARFSPITLVRNWGEGLYTIESTKPRDPRGDELAVQVVNRDERGWAMSGGPFKQWMKWKLYAPRILDLMEGGEPGREWSVDAIAKQFEIDRTSAQNSLYNLWKDGKIERQKKGKGYRYWLNADPRQTEDEIQGTISTANTDYGGGSHD